MQTAVVQEDPTKFRPSSLIRRHPLASFFFVTNTISRLLWLPLVGSGPLTGLGFVPVLLGSLVPSAVAIVLIAVLHGRDGVRRVLRRLLMWRVGIGWYLAVVLLSTLLIAAVGLSVLLGGEAPAVAATIPGVAFLFLFSIFPGSSGGEEIGWRGFALPRLQAAHSALAASLVRRAVWGVYHLPLFLIGTNNRPFDLFLPFALSCVTISIFYTWMYNGTGGSLLIVILFHATSNLPLTIFLEPLKGQVLQPYWIYVALLTVAAAILVAATGPANLSRTQPKHVAVP